jgi:hypothetical protein
MIFKVFAMNLGPGTSNMFVAYDIDTRHLYVRRETCVVPASEAGDFSDVSPDTPTCEWSNVPEGDYAVVRVKAYGVGEPGQHARITLLELTRFRRRRSDERLQDSAPHDPQLGADASTRTPAAGSRER